MPHEVFTIWGPRYQAGGVITEAKERLREANSRTAAAIQKVYDDVEDRAGEIVGDHVIPAEVGDGAGRFTNYALYLVAKFDK